MYEFDKCILAGDNGLGLAEGAVREFEGSIMKLVLNEEQDFPMLSEITVYIFNRIKGECVYRGRVVEIQGRVVMIDKAVFVKATQKRNNTRVSKTLRYKITHKFSAEGQEKLEKPIEIVILNISAQGLYISCIEEFTEGYRFPLKFMDAGRPIELEVVVMRCEYSRRGNKYGCQFLNINQKDSDNIYRFVLHEQIEQRRNNLLY